MANWRPDVRNDDALNSLACLDSQSGSGATSCHSDIGLLPPGRPLIDILEAQHFFQALFIAPGKSAPGGERFSFPECAEQPVPPRDVTKIVAVHTQLVMNGVVLGPLDEIPQPHRCADVRMIEVFSGCPEEGGPRPCQRRTAKHTIDQKARKYRNQPRFQPGACRTTSVTRSDWGYGRIGERPTKSHWRDEADATSRRRRCPQSSK